VKPPPFHYAAPTTLTDALRWRAKELDSVVLNGGQSLVATMNFRLSAPDLVIDLRNVRELDYLRIDGHWVRIGGTAKQRRVEQDEAVRSVQPLLHAALQYVAHPVIRNRGTICGSLAHADPSAEMPTLFALMRGQMKAAGPDGERTIDASEFFEFIFTTALEPEELLVEAAIPALHPGEGWAFSEFARRHGDYAVAGVGATIRLDRNATIEHARLAACGIATVPTVLESCERALIGQTATPKLFAEVGELAKESVTVSDDSATSRAYRQHVLAGLVRKNLSLATQRAVQ
jgi:carbon-monoxide dehydrogenase medium subunit